ncbi:cofactor-independent phosphoglycerate mutase [Thermosulfurimonas dismutans]|uniref:Putative homoserine kinase n=1 Tax=Thermosulfurimonas dismutans TaxID=999894 RepID=A0A179D3N5_9BACT|nr:cofactor-independent phosphoglycerate mutase [Thermosulfurimonas dismutans]OAQ20690.1 putative homoserine kinase [Thermosulfurimonas dismutans]
MKYIVLVGDGMGDFPLKELSGRTPLEVATTPGMDFLAQHGEMGLVQTVPQGMSPGSDVANMSLMGYPPQEKYTGRGPIEAASLNIPMRPEDVAFRCNLVTLKKVGTNLIMEDYSAGHISTEEARILIEDLNRELSTDKLELFCGKSYRHILLWRGGPEGLRTFPPHDLIGKNIYHAWLAYKEEPMLRDFLIRAIKILEKHPVNQRRVQENKPPANALWPWGQGRIPLLEPFSEKWGLSGAVVAAVDLIKGLGVLAGLEIIEVEGATGYLDTNYEGKALAAIEALKKHDFVFLHVEAPDEAAHQGSIELKIKAIQDFDRYVVRTILEEAAANFSEYRILAVTDHLTPIPLRTHSSKPVPFVIFDSRDEDIKRSEGFSERTAQGSGLFIPDGQTLMIRFLQKEPRLPQE